jgi:aminopeptidase
MADTYTPSPEILDKYAQVLVNFALNSGKGIKKGEAVRLVVSEAAKPLYIALRNQILKSGGHVISFYLPDDVSREVYELSSPDQLKFFPKKYFRGLTDSIDHSLAIISDTNLHELEGIDPAKIMLRAKSSKPFKDWLDVKENAGKFTWTLALYGTPAMAAEAKLSLADYWDQIIKACYLDVSDPIAAWQDIFTRNQNFQDFLNSLAIAKLHIQGVDADLWITPGANRKWIGGSGRNIPSFEVFTSPDWRGTEGWIKFNQPLYRYGNIITGIELEFTAGKVTKSSATQNYAILKKMLEVENADKIGEFSLTDKRLSRIDHFMAETLFDENISGPFGNTHIALGSAYADALSKKGAPGFNNCAIHTDIISTTDRTVTAHLTNGTQKIIYKSGEFTF